MSLLWKTAAQGGGIEVSHEDYGPYVSPRQTGGGRLTAFQGGEPVGILAYIHSSPTHVGIDNLAVRQDAQGQGIGTAMLDHLRSIHPDKALVTEDFTPDGQAFNDAYTTKRGVGIEARNPGSWTVPKGD